MYVYLLSLWIPSSASAPPFGLYYLNLGFSYLFHFFVYFMGFMNKTNIVKGWNIVPVDFVSFLLCLSSNEPFLMSFSLIPFPSLHLSFPFWLHFLTALASLCLFLFGQSSKNEEMGWSWGCGWFVSLVLIVINSGMLLITSRLGSLWRQQLLLVHTLSNYSNICPMQDTLVCHNISQEVELDMTTSLEELSIFLLLELSGN